MLPEGGSIAHFDLRYTVPLRASGAQSENQPSVERTIRPFALDRYEVTVRRFKSFVNDYDRSGEPAAQSGAHPAFPQSGWQPSWSMLDTRLPLNAQSLSNSLALQSVKLSAATDDEPIRGVNWYTAMAFCIWDGGRLPSEAEWAYAAFGGDRDYIYPWGSLRDNPIDHDRAVYSESMAQLAVPAAVGSHPRGKGQFGHEDLAGNVKEWVADTYEEMLPLDCASSSAHGPLDVHECLGQSDSDKRVLRGGSYDETGPELRNVERSNAAADVRLARFGFRCARDLPLR